MPRLHLAAASGDVEKVNAFIAEGDDINDMKESVTHEGQVWTPGHGNAGRKMTPLHLAAYNGHTAIVKILVKAGALLDARDAWRDVPGTTALEMAVCRKNFTTAIILNQLGAEVGVQALQKAIHKRDIQDELMHAAIYKKPQNIYANYAEKRLEKKAAEYALRLGAEYGTLSVIRALLDCGVDVNACDLDEQTGFNFNSIKHKTPLGIAAEYGHEDAVLLLLERGAEVDKPTHINPRQKTNTPLRQAMSHLNFKHSNPKLFEILLSYGADWKKVDDIAWRFFTEKGSAEEMAVFLKNGLKFANLLHPIREMQASLQSSSVSTVEPQAPIDIDRVPLITAKKDESVISPPTLDTPLNIAAAITKFSVIYTQASTPSVNDNIDNADEALVMVSPVDSLPDGRGSVASDEAMTEATDEENQFVFVEHEEEREVATVSSQCSMM